MQSNKATHAENEFFARQDAEKIAHMSDERDRNDMRKIAEFAATIKEGMPVLCVNGGQFAVVDHMEGESMVKLKKDAAGVHHLIPLTWVMSTAGNSVKIDRSSDKAMQHWSASAL